MLSALVGALTLSLTAGAAGAKKAERADLSVSFIAVTQNGHPVAVKKVRFRRLTATCTQGDVRLHGRLPRMPVNHRRFGNTFRSEGHRVEIHGRFRHHNRVAKGTLRLQGKVKLNGKRYTHCDSGKQRWAVGRS